MPSKYTLDPNLHTPREMVNWKMAAMSEDKSVVTYEYIPELDVHHRIVQDAWDDMALLLNACQGNMTVSLIKTETDPLEKDILKKKYRLQAVVGSSLIEGPEAIKGVDNAESS